jgi:hypothetical protein
MRYLLADLKALLQKKGLVPFHGFTKPNRKIPAPKYLFWEETKMQDQPLFSRIEASKLINSESYFWMED